MPKRVPATEEYTFLVGLFNDTSPHTGRAEIVSVVGSQDGGVSRSAREKEAEFKAAQLFIDEGYDHIVTTPLDLAVSFRLEYMLKREGGHVAMRLPRDR